jgi:hypothetical protein
VRDTLIDALTENKQDVRLLAESLPLEKEKNITVIRFLLEHDTRFHQEDGVLSLSVEK